MAVSYYFIDAIMAFVTAPAGKLYFIKPAEAFFIYFKVLLVSGLIITSPFIFYEFWAFIVPAFTSREKSALAALVPSSLLLFIGGTAFSYFVVLPRGLQFFMAFTNDTITPMISLESYLSFVFMLVVPFGFIFNLPLVLAILAKMGIITSDMLAKKRKIVYFVSFVVAAIITPTTDVISQSLLALPIIGLYEISRIVIKYILRK